MTAAFADTGFYVAATNARDALHSLAMAAVPQPPAGIVTTEFVLIEVANFFCRSALRRAFLDLADRVRSDPLTEVVPASPELFARGLALFAARPDKDWSLTDCTSFVVMADHGLADALTADQHFTQAGFRPLLAPLE